MTQKPAFVVSQKADGNMQFTGGEVALTNRRNFLLSQQINPKMVVSGQLVNGATIAIVTKADGGTKIVDTDGLITTDPTLWLSITVADCLPIVLYGEEVVALLHGGWRGLSSQIIEKAVSIIRNELKNDSKLSAYIGPGIGSQHYEVRDDVVGYFSDYPTAIVKKDGKFLLNLQEVTRAKLNKLGIDDIEVSPECTYCETDKYFSARLDKVSPVEAMMILTRGSNS